jgi:hypothetical protein
MLPPPSLFHRAAKGPFPERSFPSRTSKGLDLSSEEERESAGVGGNPHPSEPLSFAPRRGDPQALSDPGGSSHEAPFPSARRQAVMGRHGSGHRNGPIPFRMKKQDRGPAMIHCQEIPDAFPSSLCEDLPIEDSREVWIMLGNAQMFQKWVTLSHLSSRAI